MSIRALYESGHFAPQDWRRTRRFLRLLSKPTARDAGGQCFVEGHLEVVFYRRTRSTPTKLYYALMNDRGARAYAIDAVVRFRAGAADGRARTNNDAASPKMAT